MASKPDYYEVLDLPRDATPRQIKKAYKQLALANHPDRNPDDEEALARFKQASEAYEILCDENKRSLYDRYGHAGLSGSNGASSFNDIGDIFDAFGDVFGGVFGGRSRGRSGARRGESLRAGLSIDLLNAASGCSREMNIDRREQCATCVGSGAKSGTKPVQCDYCGGHGRVMQSQGFFRIQTTCPACSGSGQVIRDKCADCQGSGLTRKSVKLSLKIPAGVDSGMQLCLRGEGEAGTGGGPRGDLYVDIDVNPHPLFQREGRHLTCRVPITYSQAVLGADLEIPVLTGKHQLTIHPGTQPEEIFKLRGFGMPDPHGGPKGDLYLQVQVEVPKKIDQEQEDLIRELAVLEHANVTPHRKSFFKKLKDYFSPQENENENLSE